MNVVMLPMTVVMRRTNVVGGPELVGCELDLGDCPSEAVD